MNTSIDQLLDRYTDSHRDADSGSLHSDSCADTDSLHSDSCTDTDSLHSDSRSDTDTLHPDPDAGPPHQ